MGLFRVSLRCLGQHAFVLADSSGGQLGKSVRPLVAAATQLAQHVTLGVFSDQQAVVESAAKIPGVNRVLHVNTSAASGGLNHLLSDVTAAVLVSLLSEHGFTYLLGSTSSGAKDILPRVGALIDSQPISDVISIESDSRFKRPMYAGNVIATVESNEKVKILTVRPTAFSSATPGENTNPAPIQLVNMEKISPSKMTFVGSEVMGSQRPELGAAACVVAGGRGLKSKDNFEKILYPLADKLKAALGASRAAVDAGFAPNDLQVGQTGKIVAPELYVAVGISGAIQHVAGMKDSKTIVAINKDGDAPIFQIADYGIVGDLFEVVPDLTQKL